MVSLNSRGCCIATENMTTYPFGRFNLIEIPDDLIIVFFLFGLHWISSIRAGRLSQFITQRDRQSHQASDLGRICQLTFTTAQEKNTDTRELLHAVKGFNAVKCLSQYQSATAQHKDTKKTAIAFTSWSIYLLTTATLL